MLNQWSHGLWGSKQGTPIWICIRKLPVSCSLDSSGDCTATFGWSVKDIYTSVKKHWLTLLALRWLLGCNPIYYNWMLHSFSGSSTRNDPCFPRDHWMAQEPWTEFKILLTVCNIQVMLHIILISICCLLFHFEICNAMEVFVTCWHIHWCPLPIHYLALVCSVLLPCLCISDRAFRHYFFSSTDSVLSHQTFPKSIFPIFNHAAAAILSFPFCVFII